MGADYLKRKGLVTFSWVFRNSPEAHFAGYRAVGQLCYHQKSDRFVHTHTVYAPDSICSCFLLHPPSRGHLIDESPCLCRPFSSRRCRYDHLQSHQGSNFPHRPNHDCCHRWARTRFCRAIGICCAAGCRCQVRVRRRSKRIGETNGANF